MLQVLKEHILVFLMLGIFFLLFFLVFVSIRYSKTREFFLENDKLSMARLICFLLVVGYLFQSAWLVASDKGMPDFPATVFGLISLLYGVSKIAPNTNIQIGKGGNGK